MLTYRRHFAEARSTQRHRALSSALASVVAIALSVPCGADDGTAAASIEVRVKTVSQDAIHGRLVQLSMSDGAMIHDETGESRHVALVNLVRIATMVPDARHRRAESTLSLTDGGVLHGRVTGAQDESVLVETIDLGGIRVPLELISRIESERASQPSYRESVKWFNRATKSDEDRVLLTNGDVVRGFVTAIDGEGVSIESELGETAIPRRLVVAVYLASTPPPPLNQPHLILSFRSSGRLTVTDLEWSGNVVEARLRDGQQVRIEAERITRVDVVGGKWEWLSTHTPISYQHTPMLSLGWERVNDRNVLGGPLRVADETFERGVGVHSRSNLTYDLRGKYREFVTYLGIDDASGPLADVSARILVDGKRGFEKTGITRGTLHGPIRLDVTKANRIELIVDFGKNGDLQDRFNWIEPALIR